jgi:hypothetical protein
MQKKVVSGSGSTCLLCHDLINKLSVVIGSCEIVRERTDSPAGFDSECSRRLEVVLHIAKTMADGLREHVCELDALTKLEMMTAHPKPFQVKTKH